jgi:hypothetical protein
MDLASEYEREVGASLFDARLAWKGGAVAGFVAAVVMGVALTVIDAGIVSGSIAGLYGASGSLSVGWAAHLLHGTLFGTVFAVILADPGVSRVRATRWKVVVAGVVYGLVLAVAGAGIIMPMWLAAIGFPTPPSLPHVTATLLVWHAVYGAVLGGLFPSLDGL